MISERGSELIVNADDLRRLQKHINYPLVVQAINESRGHITQYSQGNYTMQNIPSLIKPTNEPLGIDSDLIQRLTSAIEHLECEGIQADVVLTELERKQKFLHRDNKKDEKGIRRCRKEGAILKKFSSSCRMTDRRSISRQSTSGNPLRK